MNGEMQKRAAVAAVGFILGCLIFIGLVVRVKLSTPVPAIDAGRAAVRARDLAEIRATEAQTLNHAGWIDESRVKRSESLRADSFSPREKARMRGKNTCLIPNRLIFQLPILGSSFVKYPRPPV